jgi:hypothetical protein
MTDCTERSEGQAGMPVRHRMTNCTVRSKGRAGMPIRHRMIIMCGHHGGKAV